MTQCPLLHARAPHAPRAVLLSFHFLGGGRAPRATLPQFLRKHLGQDTPRAPLRPGATAPLRPGAPASFGCPKRNRAPTPQRNRATAQPRPGRPTRPTAKKLPNPASKKGGGYPRGVNGGARRRRAPDPAGPEGPELDPILGEDPGAHKNEKRAKDPKDPKDPRKNDTFARPLEKLKNSARRRPNQFFRFSRIPSFPNLDPLDPNPLFHSWNPPFFWWTPAGPQLDPSWTRARSAPESAKLYPPLPLGPRARPTPRPPQRLLGAHRKKKAAPPRWERRRPGAGIEP